MQSEKEYSEADMVGFGSYLLSDERRKLFMEHPDHDGDDRGVLEMRLSQVHHADLENWKEGKRKFYSENVDERDFEK